VRDAQLLKLISSIDLFWQMEFYAIITLIIVGAACLLFLTDLISADLVALLVVVTLGVAGVLTPQEAFSGFGRSAVITIIAIFVLTEGLRRTAVIEQASHLLLRVAGKEEMRLVLSAMLAGAILSLFMNNIAAASVLVPTVMEIARTSQVKPSRLLLPTAFATLLGGMATLLTTTNILANSLLRDHNIPGYGLFDFSPLGLLLTLCGMIYLIVWGRKLLPDSDPISAPEIQEDLVNIYRLAERLVQARVQNHSPLAGMSLATCALRETSGMNVVAIERGGHLLLSPLQRRLFIKMTSSCSKASWRTCPPGRLKGY